MRQCVAQFVRIRLGQRCELNAVGSFASKLDMQAATIVRAKTTEALAPLAESTQIDVRHMTREETSAFSPTRPKSTEVSNRAGHMRSWKETREKRNPP